MKWVRDRTRRFAWRPYYAQHEIDTACEDIVSRFLSAKGRPLAYPISTDDLTVLIEQDVPELDLYANLSGEGRDIEGVTEFHRKRRPSVRIAKYLSDSLYEKTDFVALWPTSTAMSSSTTSSGRWTPTKTDFVALWPTSTAMSSSTTSSGRWTPTERRRHPGARGPPDAGVLESSLPHRWTGSSGRPATLEAPCSCPLRLSASWLRNRSVSGASPDGSSRARTLTAT